VSVVVGVRNGGDLLEPSLASVLEQSDVDFELLVVDDGSTDGTELTLEGWARREPRLRVLRQDAQGLTPALIRGCAASRGEAIARHDVGDLSLPGRLRRQLEVLDRHPGVGLVSCWTQVVGPEGQQLWVERGRSTPDRPRPLFEGGARAEHGGPTAHGSTMFRREAYERVDGYRAEFALGQDWDLWLRLGETTDFFCVGEPLYVHRLDDRSLSLRYRELQHAFGAASSQASRCRRAGESEVEALEQARDLSRRFAEVRARHDRRAAARASYYVGEGLRRAGYAEARCYLARALHSDPLHVRAWIRWLQSRALRRPTEKR